MSCECFKQVGHFNVETVGNDIGEIAVFQI